MAAARGSRGSCPRHRRAGLSIPGRQRSRTSRGISHAAARGCKSQRAAAAGHATTCSPTGVRSPGLAQERPFPSTRGVSVPRPVPLLAAPPMGHEHQELPPAATATAPRPFRQFSADPGAVGAFLPWPRCRPVSCPPAPALPQPLCPLPAHIHPTHIPVSTHPVLPAFPAVPGLSVLPVALSPTE